MQLNYSRLLYFNLFAKPQRVLLNLIILILKKNIPHQKNGMVLFAKCLPNISILLYVYVTTFTRE